MREGRCPTGGRAGLATGANSIYAFTILMGDDCMYVMKRMPGDMYAIWKVEGIVEVRINGLYTKEQAQVVCSELNK